MIDPKHLALAKLLEGRLFRIPQYQRAYSWGQRQRADLFADITAIVNSEPAKPHFMATVVVMRRGATPILADEYEVVDVVDGQQRLTTLIILLRALEKGLKDEHPGHEKLRRQINELLVKGDDVSLLLLQTNHDTSNVFQDYLRSGVVPGDGVGATIAERALVEAINECEAVVERFGVDKLVQLASTLRNRLTFLLHQLDDEGSVYTVFEVLNSRGLPVAWLDRLKSMLMAIAFESPGGNALEHINELHSTWQDIYRALALNRGDEELRFASVLLTGRRSRGKLLTAEDAALAIRSWCEKSVKKAIEASRWLLKVVHALAEIHQNRRLDAVTRMSQARFVAVAIEVSDFSAEDKAKTLRQWETTIFQVFVAGRKDARTLSGQLITLGVEIQNGKASANAAIQRLSAMGEEQSPLELVASTLAHAAWYPEWSTELRYLMYRYEEYLAKQDGEEVDQGTWIKIWDARDDDTIEHIAPQSWAKDEDKTSDGIFVHGLGNLTILPPKVNSALADKPFSQKREAYAKSPLRSVRNLALRNEWTSTTVELREKELLKWLQETLTNP